MRPGSRRRRRSRPNLFAERTALSWQRTTLTCLGSGLVMARLALHDSPVLALVVIAAAVVAAVGTVVAGVRRGRRSQPGAQTQAWLVGLVLVLGLGGLAYLVVTAAG